jgi:Asp-tRNA(Asn)/Glu-tRNA(Gln) amidotransferase B subunit
MKKNKKEVINKFFDMLLKSPKEVQDTLLKGARDEVDKDLIELAQMVEDGEISNHAAKIIIKELKNTLRWQIIFTLTGDYY